MTIEFEARDSATRYSQKWQTPFRNHLRELLQPNLRILDVGSGRAPAIKPSDRPNGTHYVGLDISRAELLAAPAGSYDDIVVSDVTTFVDALEGRFDLAISWQLLEHVRPLEIAIENIRRYLRPSGVFLAQTSGSRSLISLMSRFVPFRIGRFILVNALKRDPAGIFPLQLDKCYADGLIASTRSWSSIHVLARYHGASYFRFLRPVQWCYVRFEDLTVGRPNLATHYVIRASR